MRFDQLPLRRVVEANSRPLDRETWPGTLAPVRALLDGLDLGAATVIVGENGAGKSTLVEGIAGAWGFPVEGGSTWEQRAALGDDARLARHLQLVRGVGTDKSGFFLRAETMHQFAVHLRDDAESPRGQRLLTRSHGESFIDTLLAAATYSGLWILDEPESALSFQGQLTLLSLLRERVAAGSQILMSTHSPILAALPEARLVEVGEWGLRDAVWEDLEIVAHWRSFLDAPARYLRHLAP